MKKMIFSLAAVGLLASCSQNEIQEMTEKSNEIKFSTLNDKVTKHANDNKSNYRVFAKLTGATGPATAWFMNEEMIPGTSGTATPGFGNFTGGDIIKSEKKFYWPSNTGWTLNFYGFAPEDAAVTPDLTNEKLPIIYTIKTKTGTETADAQEDFTIAIPQMFDYRPDDNKVNFQFKHMLTKISIVTPVLTDELTNAGYAIAYKQEGTPVKPLTPSLNVINVTGSIEATTAAATTDPTTWTELKDAVGNEGSLTSAKTPYTGANQYLILPQPAAGNQIVLPIVITKDGVVVFDGNVTYVIKDGDNINGSTPANNNFLPGKNYGMNITIDGKSTTGPGGHPIFGPEIIFSSEVANWESSNPSITQPGQPANN